VVVKILTGIRKGLLDLASTCYDDQDFRVMSLPRVAFGISVVAVLVVTGVEQLGRRPFGHYEALTAWCLGLGATYVGKKWIDRPGRPPRPPEGGEADGPA
jgi:hypothetical protein